MLNILFGHLWVVGLTYRYIFFLQVHFKVLSHYLLPVSNIVDTGGKFANVINDTSSTRAIFTTGVVDSGGKFSAGVVDTSSKFAAGVVDTSGKFATSSLILVVHVDL